MKKCSKCKLNKELCEFYIKDGKAKLYSQCKTCVKDRRKKFAVDNPEIIKQWNRLSKRTVSINLKNKVFAGYGSKCACCGEAERLFLTLDHVNGGGTKHRKLKGTYAPYKDALNRNFPDDYQLLCYNCNCAKGFFGACPHTTLDIIPHLM